MSKCFHSKNKTPNNFQENDWKNKSTTYKTGQSNSKSKSKFYFKGKVSNVEESNDSPLASSSEKTTEHESSLINEAQAVN